MNKILITGGCGYIGSTLVQRLVENYPESTIDIVDNLLYRQNETAVFLSSLPRVRISILNALELYSKAFQKYDVIIPLAALVGMPICNKNPEKAQLVNHDTVSHIVNNITDKQLVIFPNTNSAYGTVSNNELCTEDTPINPISIYSKTKCAAEKELLNRHKNSIVFRLATVYGWSPRMRFDLLVNDWSYQAYFNEHIDVYEPEFARNFVHVNDVCRAFIFAINNSLKMTGEVYNLGDDSANMTKGQLAEQMQSLTPCTVKHVIGTKDPDQRNYIVSSKKLYDLGFNIENKFNDSVYKLIQQMQFLPQNLSERERFIYKMRNA